MSETYATTREGIIADVIGIEGGYSNHSDDSGGATKFGVTEAVARQYGYKGDMTAMPQDVAVYVYTKEYWDKINGDVILKLSPNIAMEVFDTAVNTGVHRAGMFLQVCLNGLNNKQGFYDDIEADGVIGSGTLTALGGYLTHRDSHVLLKLLNCVQGAFYLSLVEQREKDESFLYGWVANRIQI
ncbi:MAG: hypothetical protein HOA06_07770 [Chloroflexi bacterium]|nr:hypothetical protein [Chloroflexota bacterium]